MVVPSLRFATLDLKPAYEKIRAEGTRLAGAPTDMTERAFYNYVLYLDSGQNFVFPQLVAHGGLFAKSRFEAPHGTLGKAISWRYFYNSDERKRRLKMLKTFSDTLQEGNRQVFVDTFTCYAFTKLFGHLQEAREFVDTKTLNLMNAAHRANKMGRVLAKSLCESLYRMALEREQRGVIKPVLDEAALSFDCPILRNLIFKPLVRLAFFPRWRWFIYRNFANVEERIAKGMEAYKLAEKAGWEKVTDSLGTYGHLPDDFKRKARFALAELRGRLDRIEAGVF